MDSGLVHSSIQSETTASFGYWVRRRRLVMDLTQAELARRVGCARITISKIERDERRPSRQMAELLRDRLLIPESERNQFLAVALGERAVDVMPLSNRPLDAIAMPGEQDSAHNLPTSSTSFVGRSMELREISSLLEDEYCRLLTLVGPGGVGKTRLALQVAEDISALAMDPSAPLRRSGIYFVSLQSVSSPEQVASAIANALEWEQYEGTNPEAELLTYLQDKRFLLILDNFEHLLAACPLVLQILRDAPDIKVLVTSRALLNLDAEWSLSVDGMSLPLDDNEMRVASSDAVALFAERARRVRPDFSLEAEEANVIRICRLVEGMPLGIELAAAWLRRLSCAEITDEIESGLGILASDQLGVRQRHRSIRIVFDQSWALLSAEERDTLMALSVFRGGATRAAAETVGCATLTILSSLVDQSWLRVTASGRYTIHELQRQYAYERLSESSDLLQTFCAAHSAYYLTFLSRPAQQLLALDNTDLISTFCAEIDNILGAWYWAADHKQGAALSRATEALYWFSWLSTYHQEGKAAFQYAVRSLRDETLDAVLRVAYAHALASLGSINIWMGKVSTATRQLHESVEILRGLPFARRELGFAVGALGWALFRASRYDEAHACFLEAVELDEETGQTEQQAWIYCLLGTAARKRCDFRAMEQWYHQALDLGRMIDDGRTISHALQGLGLLAAQRGEYAESRRYLEDGLVTARRYGIVSFECLTLVDLGQLWEGVGELETAAEYLEEALAVARTYGKAPLTVDGLNALAHVRVTLRDYQAAQAYYEEAGAVLAAYDLLEETVQHLAGRGRLALAQDQYAAAGMLYRDALAMTYQTGDRLERGRALIGLALALHKAGYDDEAGQRLVEALEEGLSVDLHPVLLDAVSVAAVRYASERDFAYAAQLAAFVQRHQASTAETKQRSAALLADVTPHLSSEALERIWPDESVDIASVAQRLIADLSPVIEKATERVYVVDSQTLNEPLTERELQVLRLVAKGRSNREIGRELHIALGTVKSHLHRIFQKLNVQSRRQAAVRSQDLNLL